MAAGRDVPCLALPRRVHRQPVRDAPAEEQHRDHAIAGQVLADWHAGPLVPLVPLTAPRLAEVLALGGLESVPSVPGVSPDRA